MWYGVEQKQANGPTVTIAGRFLFLYSLQTEFALNRGIEKPTETSPFAYQLSVDSWYVDSQFKLLISLGSCAIILDLCDYANRRACVDHR